MAEIPELKKVKLGEDTIKISDLKKLKLDEDDVLVFQVEHGMVFGAPRYIKRFLRDFFIEVKGSFKNRIIVIPSSIKIGVIKEADIVNKMPDIEPALFNPDNLFKE